MEEVLPGVLWWTATHPKTGLEASSYWVPDAGALLDPLLPPDTGLDAFRERPPERVLLTNRHHLRHSERIAEEYGCGIHCSRPGLHEFEGGGGPAVRGFDFGEEVAPGIEALEVGAICPDETAMYLRDAGALAVADGLTRYGEEPAFFPDRLLGDDPEGVKRGLREAYTRLLDRDFESLLFAHGNPLLGDGKEALRAFCAADGN
jgi:hypothetical protein